MVKTKLAEVLEVTLQKKGDKKIFAALLAVF
jgi:hypothetical protein